MEDFAVVLVVGRSVEIQEVKQKVVIGPGDQRKSQRKWCVSRLKLPFTAVIGVLFCPLTTNCSAPESKLGADVYPLSSAPSGKNDELWRILECLLLSQNHRILDRRV